MSNTFLLNSVSRKFCPYYELLQRIFLSLEIHMKVAYHIKENGLQHALAQKKSLKKQKRLQMGHGRESSAIAVTSAVWLQ